MSIEETPGGGFVITGKADTTLYALISLAHALALEINTGMRLSRISGLQGAKNLGVIPKDKRGNKKQALRLTVEKIQSSRPEYAPTPTMLKAMGS